MTVRSEARAMEVEARFEVPMLIAAALVIPVLVVQNTSHPGSAIRDITSVLDWVIWAAFLAEAIVMLKVVPDRGRWIAEHPIEVGVVLLTAPVLPTVLQGARVLRVLRVLRLLRLAVLARRVFSLEGLRYATVIAILAALGGGAAFNSIEKAHHYGLWKGVYWAITTMTTVGYGNPAPETTGGQVIAVGLMLIGIGFVALLTGAIAERFLTPHVEQAEQEVADEVAVAEHELAAEIHAIAERLQQIEKQLARARS